MSTVTGWKASSKREADALEKDEKGASFDSGIVGAALRTEHYEIAGYTAAIAMADTLGLKDVSGLLTKNLQEEQQAAEKILTAAKPILQESANQPEEEDKKPKTGKEKYSAQKSREDEKKAAPSLVGHNAAR